MTIKIGKLYKVLPYPQSKDRHVILADPNKLGEPSSGYISYISVGEDEVVLLVAITGFDKYSAYELLALLGERLVFVRSAWIREI